MMEEPEKGIIPAIKTSTDKIATFDKKNGNANGQNGEQQQTAEVAVPNKVLEKLYHRYSIKQRRAGLGCFLAASILFDIWAILIPQGQSLQSLGMYVFTRIISLLP